MTSKPRTLCSNFELRRAWGATLKRLRLECQAPKRTRLDGRSLAKAIRAAISDRRIMSACRETALLAGQEDGVGLAVREIETVLACAGNTKPTKAGANRR